MVAYSLDSDIEIVFGCLNSIKNIFTDLYTDT
jgi:hypothetical protein